MASTENDYVLLIDGSMMLGFGGTKCIEFVLQVMGMDVCGISIGTISNHFAFKQFSVLKKTADDLDKVYAVLKANELHKRFTHIVSGLVLFYEHGIANGYVRDGEMSSKIAEIVKDIKTYNPKAIYLCDPVLGDNGDYYPIFTQTLKDELTDSLISLADITTPNQFEAECLSGITIHSQDDALTAIQRIHDLGPSIVILTSFVTEEKDVIVTIGSGWTDGKREVYRIDYPKIDAYIVGTGDLLAGCFMGLLRKTENLKTSLEKAISIVQIACQRTFREAKERFGPGVELKSEMLELRVPQCTSFVLDPQIIYASTKLL